MAKKFRAEMYNQTNLLFIRIYNNIVSCRRITRVCLHCVFVLAIAAIFIYGYLRTILDNSW